MKSDLSNTHLGEHDGFELIDVHFNRLSVFSRDRCPLPIALADFVMRAGYPRVSEIKRVAHLPNPKGSTYRLYVQRDPCPVLFFGGPICPICGESHE